MTTRTNYYAIKPLVHEKVRYDVAEKLALTDKQAEHLYLANKVTACSRAAQIIKQLKDELAAVTGDVSASEASDNE